MLTVMPALILCGVAICVVGFVIWMMNRNQPKLVQPTDWTREVRPQSAPLGTTFTQKQIELRRVICSAIVHAWWTIFGICALIGVVLGIIYGVITH
jgi:hypothetical protein